MRTYLTIFILTCCFQSIAQRTLNFGVSSGVTQFYSSASQSSNKHLLTPQANPMLGGPFRYISVDAQLGVTTAFGVSLGMGYNELIGSFESYDNPLKVGLDYYEPLFKSVFLEPGVVYMTQLDERLHIITSLSASANFNISKNFRPQMQLLNKQNEVISDFHRTDPAVVYLTINPAVEIRSIATTSLRFGLLLKYFQGLGTMMRYGGAFHHNEIPETYSATYTGSGLLMGIRVSYCLACSN